MVVCTRNSTVDLLYYLTMYFDAHYMLQSGPQKKMLLCSVPFYNIFPVIPSGTNLLMILAPNLLHIQFCTYLNKTRKKRKHVFRLWMSVIYVNIESSDVAYYYNLEHVFRMCFELLSLSGFSHRTWSPPLTISSICQPHTLKSLLQRLGAKYY